MHRSSSKQCTDVALMLPLVMILSCTCAQDLRPVDVASDPWFASSQVYVASDSCVAECMLLVLGLVMVVVLIMGGKGNRTARWEVMGLLGRSPCALGMQFGLEGGPHGTQSGL